jgi:hypothetical protein
MYQSVELSELPWGFGEKGWEFDRSWLMRQAKISVPRGSVTKELALFWKGGQWSTAEWRG